MNIEDKYLHEEENTIFNVTDVPNVGWKISECCATCKWSNNASNKGVEKGYPYRCDNPKIKKEFDKENKLSRFEVLTNREAVCRFYKKGKGY